MLKKVKRIKLGKQVYRRLMKRVMERDGWRCQKCGSLENLQVHHTIRRSQQGNDSLENLVTLCARCHMKEHGQLAYEVEALQVIKRSRHAPKLQLWWRFTCVTGPESGRQTIFPQSVFRTERSGKFYTRSVNIGQSPKFLWFSLFTFQQVTDNLVWPQTCLRPG